MDVFITKPQPTHRTPYWRRLRRRIDRTLSANRRRRSVQLEKVMLAQMSQAVIAVDTMNQIIFVNQAAEQLYHIRRDDVIGHPYHHAFTAEWLSDDDRDDAYAAMERSGTWEGQLTHYRVDGSALDVYIVCTRVFDNGRVVALVSSISDISDRLQARKAELEQTVLAEGIAEATGLLTQSLNVADVMRRILEQVGRVVQHDAANIMVIEGEGARIKFATGYTPEVEAAAMAFTFPMHTMKNLRAVMLTGKPLVIPNVNEDPDWVSEFEFPQASRGQSFLCAPITSHGQVIGFLNLDRFGGHQFSDIDAKRLTVFANQAAVALTNADLFSALFHETAQLRRLQRATALLFNTNLLTSKNLEGVCAQIAEVVVNEFQKVDCGVLLVDEARGTLVRYTRAGDFDVHAQTHLKINLPTGLVPAAVRSGDIIYAPDVTQHPLYIPSEARTRSELVIPLKTHDRVLGVLDLQSAELDAFNDQSRDTLRTFAHHIAVVLENLSLINEIRTANEQLEARVIERTADLNRTRERVEAILNSTSDGVLLIHADKGIQQTNPAFDAMFGCTPDTLYGIPIQSIGAVSEHQNLDVALRDAVRLRQTQRIEVVMRRADGTIFDADIAIAPIKEPGGIVKHVVCSIHDISERKQLERQLEQAFNREQELVDLKSIFIRDASHELRTPLAVINSSVDVLLMFGDRKSAEERTAKFHTIQQQVRVLANLLEQLSALNHYQYEGRTIFHIEPILIGEFCEDVIRRAKLDYGAHHRFALTLTGDCKTIRADREVLERMLKNLLMNACMFSPAGSLVTCAVLCDPAFVEIRVIDEGVGIAEAHRKHLFEPFYRVREDSHAVQNEQLPGSGMGLALVKQAVEMHGGRVWVEENTAQCEGGAVFAVRLPTDYAP